MPLVVGLAVLFAFLLALFLVNAVAYAYRRIGIGEGASPRSAAPGPSMACS